MPLEAAAREEIDRALLASGWLLQDFRAMNLYAGPGVAVREVQLAQGHGVADYLLYADGQAVGVIEAKRVGETLTGVELQSEKYGAGLPAGIPAPVRPLPFLYQSTGVETRFTNRLDPVPKSRDIFAFHTPTTLAAWASAEPLWLPIINGVPHPHSERPATFRTRLTAMPGVEPGSLWPAQLDTVRNLESSLAAGRPRALVQMATGSGKTIAAVASIYRLLKFAGARRVLFLVDRANLGRQALKEFQSYRTPDDGRLFTELYNVQRLTANRVDPVANVVIGTVQRLYSMLRGEPAMSEEVDELDADSALDAITMDGTGSTGGLNALRREAIPIAYNPDLPVELFDVVFIDESHRSIYTLWRQVVQYWDAFLVGLTATPSTLTYGFFDANVVQEYGHEHAVADGVNVDFDVYRIRTAITEGGSTVEAGQMVDRRDRETRRRRWEQLDQPLVYDAAALDRDVVAPDQIRTVVRAFRDRFLPEVFPERTHVPKTLVFAKDDSHADDLVKILRDELGLGNDAVQKITYKTGTARIVERVTGPDGQEVERISYKSSGVRPEDLLQSFRNSYHPRIAVTVDMIATGTDVKPLEVLWFMRTVRSRTLFEQMKGRGVRVVAPDDLRAVTPDAEAKTRYVMLDCVGVCEEPLADTRPMDRQPTVSLDRLLQAVAMGNVDPEVASTLASRLVRLDARLGRDERASVVATTGGPTLRDLAHRIVDALDPDRQRAAALAAAAPTSHAADPNGEPGDAAVARAGAILLRAALAPIAGDPQLRERLLDLKRAKEQTIDTASVDTLLGAGLSAEARDRALGLTTRFEAFLAENRDELTALRLLYGSREPGQARLTRASVEELRQALLDRKPPLALDAVWQAYETLDRARVHGAPARQLTDVVALVRFATHRDDALSPIPAVARARLDGWLARAEAEGRAFTPDQRTWLLMMAEHVAANVEIEAEDFDDPPFTQRGGLAGAHRVFGAELPRVLEEIGEVIAA